MDQDNYEVSFTPDSIESQVTPQAAEPEVASQAAEPETTGHTSPFADSPYVMENASREPWDAFPKAAAKPKKSGKGWKIALCCVLAFSLLAGSCGITALCVSEYWKGLHADNQAALDRLQDKIDDLQEQINDKSFTGSGNSVSGTPNLSVEGMTPGQVYAKNVATVVAISATATTNNGGQIYESGSTGSGFIVRQDGYVVTNYHVVEGATTIEVTISTAAVHPAKLIGYEATNDIALLKIDVEGLPAATLGSSDDLIVGDQVVAIGNPLGELTSTLTVGYVSAKDRDVTTESSIINMIQTDAAINSGNSGGPLFNMKGEVVGITTAKYSGTSSSGASIEGIGFAIPIDDVAKKLQDLMEFGFITGAYLGVGVRDMDASVAESFGIPMGAHVQSVTEGSCAQIAGIRPKDIIVSLGSYDVSSINDLTRALQNFKAGDITVIGIWRSGTLLELDITLDAKPQQTAP